MTMAWAMATTWNSSLPNLLRAGVKANVLFFGNCPASKRRN